MKTKTRIALIDDDEAAAAQATMLAGCCLIAMQISDYVTLKGECVGPDCAMRLAPKWYAFQKK